MSLRAAENAVAVKQPARILVVEDESIVAMDLEWQLRQMGYEVCARVDTGLDAVAAARAHQPDLVLMDIVIKGEMDGVDAAESIGRNFHIPILFLTAYSDDQTVNRAVSTGPFGYLTKPFQSRELHAAIELALYKALLERRLRESEQWFAATLRCVADGVVATDPQGRIRFVNPAAETMLGWSMDDARGRDVTEVVSLEDPEGHAAVALPTRRVLEEGTVAAIDFGTLLVGRNGERLPIDDSAAPIQDDAGKLLGAVIVFRDVRERMEVQTRLLQSEQRFRQAFDAAPGGVALISLSNRFIQVNRAFCKLLGASQEELTGASHDAFREPDDNDREQQALMALRSGNSASEQFERRYRRKTGKPIWALVSVSLLVRDDDEPCYLFQVSDISERKQAEEQLLHLAHFDALTGLANRLRLGEEIERAIVSARRHQERLAVIFLDLDHFKQVNDNLGHEAGDELLRTIAARLRSAVRESDTVGRLGGDEFVMLLPEVHDVDDVLLVAEKVREACLKPIQVAGQEVRIGASLGVSLFPDDATDARTLLRYADSALYHAKEEGRNHLQFYRPELSARMEQRMRLGSDLRTALERDEFELHFQPIVLLDTGRAVGAEALIRWNHPELGVLGPDNFMSLVEDVGISGTVGAWVVKEACREAMRWNMPGGRELVVSVNASASQFRTDGLVQAVQQALANSGLPVERLRIEVTEQTLFGNTVRNRATLAALRGLGVRIAIDDFGTGYSSLSYIGQLQPSGLKIDRSLIAGGDFKDARATIFTAAIAMARGLNLDVVTEGVETEAQQAFLKERGCEMAQGFLYSRPLPGPAFLHWLQNQGAPAIS